MSSANKSAEELLEELRADIARDLEAAEAKVSEADKVAPTQDAHREVQEALSRATESIERLRSLAK